MNRDAYYEREKFFNHYRSAGIPEHEIARKYRVYENEQFMMQMAMHAAASAAGKGKLNEDDSTEAIIGTGVIGIAIL